jgi:hypothetical protein
MLYYFNKLIYLESNVFNHIYIYNLRMWLFKYGTKTFVLMIYHIQDMESFAMSDSFI